MSALSSEDMVPGEEPLRDADPFDPAALRISPDFEAVAVKRLVVAVPVRKPKRQEFVRVHPDEHYRLEAAGPGERPAPVCMVARELRSGRLLRLWRDQLRALRRPPFAVGPEALLVAYYASAELGCFLALGWPLPARVLDLFAEFRAATNGLPTPCGAGLLGALQWHGLEAMAADEKTAMRDLVLRGEPWSAAERLAVLDYCQADVDALAALLPRMLPGILGRQGDAATALGQALLRGRYMAAAAARMEWAG